MKKLVSFALLSLLAACAQAPTQTAECEPQQSTATAPWNQLSDAQLHAEIQRACGRVFLGFKEADASRGVDEQGRSITSAETVARMKSYVLERGFTVEHEYQLIPTVAGRIPTRLDLVTELRSHPNIDNIEPLFPGARW